MGHVKGSENFIGVDPFSASARQLRSRFIARLQLLGAGSSPAERGDHESLSSLQSHSENRTDILPPSDGDFVRVEGNLLTIGVLKSRTFFRSWIVAIQLAKEAPR